MRLDFSTPDTSAYVVQLYTSSLGDNSHVVVVDGEAAVIDPQRDIRRFEDALANSGARLVAVFETHVHNDYVSGGPALAAQYNAAYVLPRDSGASVPHTAIGDSEAWPLGGWHLRAMHTPGHTPHHFSYVLEAPHGRVAVFSGGSMLVGAVGRTDLISPERTEELTHLQYRSVNRIADEMPDPATVGPTHGAGSFCSSGGSSETTSTIEREKRQNPALTADESSFVERQIEGYGLYPAYYPQIGPINRSGAEAVRELAPARELSPDELDLVRERAWLVDLRAPREFAGAHIPGSINVPIAPDAAVYIGWTLPWDSDLVLIGGSPGDVEDTRLGLERIGFGRLAGVVTDGLTAWLRAGRPVDAYRVAAFADLLGEQPTSVVDVRDPVETRDGKASGAMNIHFSQLLDRTGETTTDRATWVYCASGFRAAIGASILHRAGRDVVLVVDDFANLERKSVAP